MNISKAAGLSKSENCKRSAQQIRSSDNVPDARNSSLDQMQYRVLKWISPGEPGCMSGDVYKDKIKIRVVLGDRVLDQLRGKVVIDFGCGEGDDAIALAKSYALRVIGLDIREARKTEPFRP